MAVCPAPMRPQGMHPSMHAPRRPARLSLQIDCQSVSPPTLNLSIQFVGKQLTWQLYIIYASSNINLHMQ